jgi:hypothetical protein
MQITYSARRTGSDLAIWPAVTVRPAIVTWPAKDVAERAVPGGQVVN